jgi:hypothetical protein
MTTLMLRDVTLNNMLVADPHSDIILPRALWMFQILRVWGFHQMQASCMQTTENMYIH